MKLVRVTSQSTQTVAQHFVAVSEENRSKGADPLNVKVLKEFAGMMAQLESSSAESGQVYASVTDLNVTLLTMDDENSPAFAHLSPDMVATGDCVAHISYRMIAADAPWENAHVGGVARNVSEVRKMIGNAVGTRRPTNNIYMAL